MARSARAFGGDSSFSQAARDSLFRGLVHSAAVARAAAAVTAAAVDEYLDSAGLGADKDAAAARVAELAAGIEADDLATAVRTRVVPCVARVAARARHQAAKQRRAALPPGDKGRVSARARRAYPALGGAALAPSAGVVLTGPRALVERGLAAARALLVDAGFRGVRFVSVPAADQAVADPGGVTVGAPWWDALFHAPGCFRQFFGRLEKDPRLGAEPDFVLADDLGRAPRGGESGTLVVRALAAYKVLAGVAKARGGVLVAGLPLDGRQYAQKDMAELTNATRRLDLYEEGGLLYATDGLSAPVQIPEPDPSPT